jgi:hypothetical protein
MMMIYDTAKKHLTLEGQRDDIKGHGDRQHLLARWFLDERHRRLQAASSSINNVTSLTCLETCNGLRAIICPVSRNYDIIYRFKCTYDMIGLYMDIFIACMYSIC